MSLYDDIIKDKITLYTYSACFKKLLNYLFQRLNLQVYYILWIFVCCLWILIEILKNIIVFKIINISKIFENIDFNFERNLGFDSFLMKRALFCSLILYLISCIARNIKRYFICLVIYFWLVITYHTLIHVLFSKLIGIKLTYWVYWF